MLESCQICKSEGGPLRIAFFTNGYPLTSEAFIQLSARALLERGHQVDIFGIGNAQPTGFAIDPSEFSDFSHTFETVNWPKSWPRRFLSLPKTMAQAVKRHGASALTQASPRIYRRTFADLTVWSQLTSLPKDGEYDILHCQFATLAEYVLKHVQAGFLSGKIISHFRGYDITEVVNDQGPDVYDGLWGTVDGFIANCEHFANRAKSLGCPTDHLTVIGSGIDLRRFSFEDPRPFDPSSHELTCVMIGRLNERKGIDVGLKALAKVKARTGVSLNIEIIGDGELRPKLTALADELGLNAETQFSGWQSHDYIAEKLRESHLLLALSQTTASGAQDAPVNTLKEAIATGVIVVATDHGGIPELVADGVTGFVGREGDEYSVADAICRAIDTQNRWPKIAQDALHRVQEFYAIDRVTEKQIAFYQEIIDM